MEASHPSESDRTGMDLTPFKLSRLVIGDARHVTIRQEWILIERNTNVSAGE